MADNFFGFDTKFPSSVLGRKALDEDFFTADVEDEYDALNDETFGQAANDDWEEAHEKLSELIIRKNDLGNSVFDDSLLENDESQDEIVSKSISQLGLEDDLDDPAIMTVARNCHLRIPSLIGNLTLGVSGQTDHLTGTSAYAPQGLRSYTKTGTGHLRSAYRSSSPPPPAILETEDCGSPKTHSIWSTTPKDSGIPSLLQSLNHSSSSISHHVLAASTARFFQFQRYAATFCQFLIFRVFKSFSTSSIHLVGGLPLVRGPKGFLNV
ncbi:protein PAT1 1 [Trichonephila clavipes]|nr:protein PAT1 1 [Trichonephila clavipes]